MLQEGKALCAEYDVYNLCKRVMKRVILLETGI